MNQTDQEYFRSLIKKRISDIEKAVQQSGEDVQAIAPDKAIGRLSRLDSMQMQQMALNAQRRKMQEIRQLKLALQRIDAGQYGYCQFCRQEIPRERLEYMLDAITCVKCAGG